MKKNNIDSNARHELKITIDDCWNKIGSWRNQGIRCSKLAIVGHCVNCKVYGNTGRRLLNRTAPEGYLEEWKEFLASSFNENEIRYHSFVIFKLADYCFSLPTHCFEHVEEFSRVHALPHTKNKIII